MKTSENILHNLNKTNGNGFCRYRILNGIWKNYYIYRNNWHIDFHPNIYDENNNIVAKTNNSGGSYNTECYYNHTSRRHEQFCFSEEKKTVKYKSLGHWEKCDIEYCHTSFPHILPSTTKNMQWTKELAVYKDKIPTRFEGILDFKRWGNNQELFLYFTDITNLNKYMLKTTNDSRYSDTGKNINFITNAIVGYVFSISKGNDNSALM